MEKLLESCRIAHDLQYMSLRYFNAAGADPFSLLGERHYPESHLIPLILDVAMGQRGAIAISIFGNDYPTPDGTCIRDYVHVSDLVQAHLLALDRLTTEGCSDIYNIGNSRGYSVNEVIDAIEKVTGMNIPVVEAPRRPGDTAELIADSTKIREKLGWEPQYEDLERIVQTAWKWHSQRYAREIANYGYITTMTTTPNIIPFDPIITQQDRHIMNAHKSGLIWFYGLSGSGKSTLAHQVEARLYQKGIQSYVLDGDNVRRGLNTDLSLSPEDRKENIRRIAEVAKLMVDAGILVFAAFIAPYEESRRFVRELLSGWPYFECYVKCPLEICEQRDPKGLYQMARQGEIPNMTGISTPFEAPVTPDLIVETDRCTLNDCTDQVIQFLNSRRLIILR